MEKKYGKWVSCFRKLLEKLSFEVPYFHLFH